MKSSLNRAHRSILLIVLSLAIWGCSSEFSGFVDISSERLEKMIAEGVAVIDIRRRDEWRQTGIIEGSHTLTLFDQTGKVVDDFFPRITQLVKKDQPVVIICRTGNRSRTASHALAQQFGYTQVYNVDRGISDWIAKGKAVKRYRS